MKANILDFDGSGRAIIELQRYNNISILENFGFSSLKDVERDIERADTPERTEFLRRYIKAYKESFRSLPQSYICEPEDYNSDVEMCDQSRNPSALFHSHIYVSRKIIIPTWKCVINLRFAFMM